MSTHSTLRDSCSRKLLSLLPEDAACDGSTGMLMNEEARQLSLQCLHLQPIKWPSQNADKRESVGQAQEGGLRGGVGGAGGGWQEWARRSKNMT